MYKPSSLPEQNSSRCTNKPKPIVLPQLPPERTVKSASQTASRSVQPFLHSSRQNVPVLYNGSPLPTGGFVPRSNSWFGAHRVHIPNDISIGSTVFAGITIVTDRRTDRQTAASTCVVLRCGLIIVRPHRSTTYVDAADCYRPSSVVCQCLSVSLSGGLSQ